MVVLCDTFDWTDYPAYFDTEDTARRAIMHPPNMAKVMECYDLQAEKSDQMAKARSMALS